MQFDVNLLMVVLYWVLFGLSLVLLSGVIFQSHLMAKVASFTFSINFGLRFFLACLNETFLVFEPKVMGELSLKMFESFILDGENYIGLLKEPFGSQIFLNLPIWGTLGPSRESLLISNVAIGSLVGPIAALMLRQPCGRRGAFAALVLFSLYPCGINFSIFGLRDPVLFLANTVLACGMVRFSLQTRRWWDVLAFGLAAWFSLWLRPEQFFIVSFILILPLVGFYRSMFRQKRNRRRAVLNGLILSLPLVLVGGIAVVAGTYVAAKNIGMNTLNPVQIADENAEDRFSRASDASFGGGTHILETDDYANTPVYLRVPLQILGMVVLPLPWLLKGLPQLFALLDSLLLIYLILVATKFYRRRRRSLTAQSTVVLYLLSTFAIGICGMGFVVSNAGNGFRMRLSLVPFVLAASAVTIGYRNRRETDYLMEPDEASELPSMGDEEESLDLAGDSGLIDDHALSMSSVVAP